MPINHDNGKHHGGGWLANDHTGRMSQCLGVAMVEEDNSLYGASV